MHATVVTSVKRDQAERAEQLLASKVLLLDEGEEITVYAQPVQGAAGRENLTDGRKLSITLP